MSKVFLQPARSPEAAANILKSLNKAVGNEIFDGLNLEEKARAISELGEPDFRLWSPKDGKKNPDHWRKMSPGDTVLIFEKGSQKLRRFQIQGTFLNEQIGLNVWGPWKNGAVFKHLYSLGDELDCELTLERLGQALGYKERWTIQSFSLMDPQQSSDILQALNTTPRKRRSESGLALINRGAVLRAMERIDRGGVHPFSESKKFDVVHNGKRYPPKALAGLATIEVRAEPLLPSDFSGGAGSYCHIVLKECGFEIEVKESAFPPTHDPDKLQNQVRELTTIDSSKKPSGNKSPERVKTEQERFSRCPHVTTHVLKRAKGICECCGSEAPFKRDDGTPYLEVHHVEQLGDDGPDIVENAVGICPNCHRECHSGENRSEITKKLESILKKLYGTAGFQ